MFVSVKYMLSSFLQSFTVHSTFQGRRFQPIKRFRDKILFNQSFMHGPLSYALLESEANFDFRGPRLF